MATPDLSAVFVEYNCVEVLCEAISALKCATNGLNLELIVVSNSNYSEDEQQRCRGLIDSAQWIFNKTNLGFARAANIGLRAAGSDFIALVNADAFVASGSLADLLLFMRTNPTVGLIGPKIVDRNGRLQDSCRQFMTISRMVRRQLQRIIASDRVILEHRFGDDTVHDVDWIIGAFMLTRRDAVSRVGGLDEGYFLYVEDMDWCRRFWQNGYSVVYSPALTVCYEGDRKSVSALASGRVVDRHLFHHIRGCIRFWLKNRGTLRSTGMVVRRRA